jgi:hypothetical protein
MNRLHRSALFVLPLLATLASSAYAQPAAQSFEQLQVLVPVGNEVKLTDSAGNRLAGKIAAILADRLILDVGGKKTTYGERDVLEITRRAGDPLTNGAWWGFAVGAGFGSLGYGVFCATEACSAIDILIIPVYGAMGAGVGVAVDALIRGEKTVYRAPNRQITTSVAPIFGRRKGIGLAITF